MSAAYNEEAAPVGLGYRSAIGRYLRSRYTWDRPDNLGADETDETLRVIVAALRRHILTVTQRQGEDYGVQIIAGALRWEPGDGRAAGPDPVRTRSLRLRRREVLHNRPNHYFAGLYADRAPLLSGVAAREHTGQVSVDDRIQREDDFRHRRLAALFCSPTMELGVDISDLNVVHMRNVPPTPANYAQRSGRAGRGGRPALVLAFCSQGNGHDQYFFRRKDQMIAGAVAPAWLDLSNRELVEAHLHSVWLAEVGLSLGVSVADLLDLDEPDLPLLPERRAQIELSEARQREVAEAFRQVLGELGEADYAPVWLAERVREAPRLFDGAEGRWRELYRAAAAFVDVCQHCGTRLDAETSRFPQMFFDQPTVRVSPQARISSDEEERSREGYYITTHYRFAPQTPPRHAHVVGMGGERRVLLEAQYAPRAELWRINHGWRRSAQRNGFTLDTKTGRWQTRDNDEIESETVARAWSSTCPFVVKAAQMWSLR